MNNSPRSAAGILAAALLAAVALAGCSKSSADGKPAKPAGPPPAPVTIGEVSEKPVPIRLVAVGSVEAYSSVMVKSRVEGQLVKVWFEEGQEVREGDILFTIDPRPLEATLKQAQADLAKAEALLKQAQANKLRDAAQAKYAREQAARYARLLEQNVVSKDEHDTIKANADAAEALVHADAAAEESARESIQGAQAAIDTAKLQLDYTTIRSPLSGRTGRHLVDQGNLVRDNDASALVVVNRMDPIYVAFSLPDRYLDEVRRFMAAGPLLVMAVLPHEEGRPVAGRLEFLDNEVDQNTGTIRAKAVFDNPERRLWPGQFVQAEVTLRTIDKAITAPAKAVQTGADGQFVYVLRPDMTVEARKVAVGVAAGSEVVIENGLRPGEKVVTDGHLRLTPGAKVEVKGMEAAEKETTRTIRLGVGLS